MQQLIHFPVRVLNLSLGTLSIAALTITAGFAQAVPELSSDRSGDASPDILAMLQFIKQFALFLRWEPRTALAALLSLCGLSVIRPTAAIAADRLTLYYSSLQFSLSIDALETYAKTGEITSEFAPYARFLNETQLIQLQLRLPGATSGISGHRSRHS